MLIPPNVAVMGFEPSPIHILILSNPILETPSLVLEDHIGVFNIRRTICSSYFILNFVCGTYGHMFFAQMTWFHQPKHIYIYIGIYNYIYTHTKLYIYI